MSAREFENQNNGTYDHAPRYDSIPINQTKLDPHAYISPSMRKPDMCFSHAMLFNLVLPRLKLDTFLHYSLEIECRIPCIEHSAYVKPCIFENNNKEHD